MKEIAICGAGGFGKEVACLIDIINKEKPTWNFIGYFDDGKEIGYSNGYGSVLGRVSDLNKWDKPLSLVIAIGSPNAVRSVSSEISNSNIDYPNLISPNLILLDPNSVSLGKGNIFCSGCLVSCNVTIGDFNIFNWHITVGHDANIGNFNSFMPAVRISGEVHIGDCNFFGVSSVVLQQLKIGDNIRLGAGSVLMTKPKNGGLYVGNPAKLLKL